MNESIAYEKAVGIALSPKNLSQAEYLWSEMSMFLMIVIFVPTVIFLFVSGIFSIFEEVPVKKLWKNENFWIVVLMYVFIQALFFMVSPYLIS